MSDSQSDPDDFAIEDREDPTEDLEGVSLPHSSSTWKVLGETSAADGIGVLGHNTSGSGTATGIRGVVDSPDTGAAGVHGEATNSAGTIYGVEAISRSADSTAAAVRARANNGARGVYATASDQIGVYGRSTNSFGLAGFSENNRGIDAGTNDGGRIGVFGHNFAGTNSGGTGYGVRGETSSVGSGSAGVRGDAQEGSGQTYGVHGVTQSVDPGTAGVRGESTATSGVTVETYGVHGVSAGDGTLSADTPAGVKGTATGGGENAGVLAVTESTAGRAAGVKAVSKSGSANAILARGEDTGHGIEAVTYGDNSQGVWARTIGSSGTSNNHGVLGETYTVADGVSAVRGNALATTGRTYGVEGVTDSLTADAAGVRGEATASSGSPFGVDGVTRTPNGTGVRGRATNGSGTFGTGVFGATESSGSVFVDPISGATFPLFTAAVQGSANATSGNAVNTAGVIGDNRSSTGVGHGIRGTTASNNVNAAGVQGIAFNQATGVQAESRSGTGLSVTGFSTSGDNTPTPSQHAALIEDIESSNSSVLAVKTGDTSPSSADNLITFYAGDNTAIGTVESDGSGGVNYTSGSADYAEFMPRLDTDEEIEAADVVGVVGGAVTKRTAEADQALVVSSHPIVTGNSPGNEPEDRRDHETVAFVGQIPVKVRGTVEKGDLIVPSGEHDGTGRAIAAGSWTPGDGPVVGRAWEATDEESVDRVTVAVGLETGEALEPAVARHGERIAEIDRANDRLREELDRKDQRIQELATELEALRAEKERLRSQNEALQDRLTGLDDRLASLERGGTSPASADD